MRPEFRQQAWLILVAGMIFFVNLGVPALWDVDEPRNAGCAAEMLKAGDWIVPTFNGELRAHKPVLVYWLMMAAYEVFGVSEFAARFFSAVLAIGTVLVTYRLGRLLFSARVGFFAGLILASSLNFAVVARAATPDSLFIFLITLSAALFVEAALGDTANSDASNHVDGASRWRKLYFPLGYAALGAAVLAKGPVALVLTPLVIALAIQLGRRKREEQSQIAQATAAIRNASSSLSLRPAASLVESERAGVTANAQSASLSNTILQSLKNLIQKTKATIASELNPAEILATLRGMRPLLAVAILTLVALPWYVAVAWKTNGAWLHEFFLTHNVGRFLEPMENHRGPIFYYLIALSVGFFPWSVFLLPAIVQLWRRTSDRHAWRYGYCLLAGWSALYLVFFSLARTKLPHYILPAYPAIALAAACFLDSLLGDCKSPQVRWLKFSLGTSVVAGIGIVATLAVVSARHLPGETVIALAGAIPIAGGLLALYFLSRRNVTRMIAAFASAAVLLAISVFGFALVRADRHQHSQELIAAINHLSDGQAELASFAYFRPSWVYYAAKHIDEFTAIEEARRFLESTEQPYLITTGEGLRELTAVLPSDIDAVLRRPQFLKPGEIVVLARKSTSAASQARTKSLNR